MATVTTRNTAELKVLGLTRRLERIAAETAKRKSRTRTSVGTKQHQAREREVRSMLGHEGPAPANLNTSGRSAERPETNERYDFRPRGLAARLERRMYPGGRPNRLARLLNRWWAFAHGTGLLPRRYVTLEVPGRRTGRMLSFPLVMTHFEGERYLVSMLGEDSNWVRNVRAAGGRATLRHGRREPVRLEEVDPAARAPIVRRYLSLAPGPRAFIPADRDAPLEEFGKIAPQIPVFRIRSGQSAPRKE